MKWKHVIRNAEGVMEDCVFDANDVINNKRNPEDLVYDPNEFICGKCKQPLKLEDIDLVEIDEEENPFSDDIYPARLLQ